MQLAIKMTKTWGFLVPIVYFITSSKKDSNHALFDCNIFCNVKLDQVCT